MIYEKKTHSWGNESEKAFIEGLGTWRLNAPEDPADILKTVKRALLRKYIEAHESSPHKHHKFGVGYAKTKLAELGG